MKDKKKTQNAFLEAISILIDKKLKKLKFNYYVDGVIQEKNSDNTYNVLINGNIYKNIPSQNKLKYSPNDIVQILVKNGDWNKKFIDDKSSHNDYIKSDNIDSDNIKANNIESQQYKATDYMISQQYKAIDGTGEEFPLISHNGDNIWIGAKKRASRHHAGKGTYGKLYISSGYNADSKQGNETIYVSVPNDSNDNATNYAMMHSGNQLDYIYPVDSVYITSTNTNPASKLGGVWELIDKGFSTKVNVITVFSPATNVSCTSAIVVRDFKTVRVRIILKINAEMSDTGMSLGILDLSTVGVTSIPYAFGDMVSYDDGANGGISWDFQWNTGELKQTDVIETSPIPSGKEFTFEFVFIANMGNMIDSFCDKFYWKRTA